METQEIGRKKLEACNQDFKTVQRGHEQMGSDEFARVTGRDAFRIEMHSRRLFRYGLARSLHDGLECGAQIGVEKLVAVLLQRGGDGALAG
jgi:hypothetical protein